MRIKVEILSEPDLSGDLPTRDDNPRPSANERITEKTKNKRDSRKVAPLGKKTTITLSLDEAIMKELRRDAEQDKSSLNSKVNFVLERYVSFYKYAELLGSVIIPQTQFRNMLDIMDEEQLTNIMKTSGNANVLSVFSNLGIAPDLNGLVKYCFRKFIRWSGAYDSVTAYIDNEGYPCLVFEHKFGIKWSRIMAETVSETIQSILEHPTQKRSCHQRAWLE